MTPIIYIGVIVAIIAFASWVSIKNYKNRGKKLNNNMLEYCLYIIEQYDILTSDEKKELDSLLTDKESMLLKKLIAEPNSLGKNLYVLQGQMIVLESIMKNIKHIISRSKHILNENDKKGRIL